MPYSMCLSRRALTEAKTGSTTKKVMSLQCELCTVIGHHQASGHLNMQMKLIVEECCSSERFDDIF